MKQLKAILLMIAVIISMNPYPVFAEEVREAWGNYYNIAFGNGSVDAAVCDGDETTGWTFDRNTISIDLGGVYKIKKVEILSSESNVMISGWGESGKEGEGAIEGQKARFIYLSDGTFAATEGASASVLYEVRVFASEVMKDDIKNIALGNTSAGGTAAMFDGDQGTSAVCPAPDFVVDLGAVYTISSIEIDVAETTGSVSVSRYSLDNGNWIQEAPSAGAQLRYFVISDFGYYNGGGVYSTVNEIEVFALVSAEKNVALNNVTEGPEAAMYDGDETTGWTCTYYDFVVDLGAVYALSSVEIAAQTTHSVAVQCYSTDNINWIYESPSGGAKARYLLITDYGYYWGGNVPSTIFEIRANVLLASDESVYHITYDANGGANPPSDDFDYEYGACIKALRAGDMEKDRCIFKGWSTEEGENNSVEYSAGSRINLTQDLTLYAVWEESVEEGSRPAFESAFFYAENGTGLGHDLKHPVLGFSGTVSNPSNVELELECILALFDENGRMVSRAVKTVRCAGASKAPFACEMKNEPEKIKNGYQLKVFLWRSMKGQEPLAQHFETAHTE